MFAALYNQITKNALKQLPALVAAKNLPEIQRIIYALKAKYDYRWTSGDDDQSINRAIRDALIAQEYDIVKFFIADANVDPNNTVAPNEQISYVRPLIHYAVKTGKLPFVQLLVENGAKIKPRDNFDRDYEDTGIRTAVEEGHSQIAEYLLALGAEPNGVIGGMRRDTFIAYAAARNDIAMVDVLVRFGAFKHLESSFNLATEKYGEEIKHYKSALKNGYSDSARNRLVEEAASAKNHMKFDYESSLKEFDEKRQEVAEKYERLVQEHERILLTLMDYAVGYDFSPKERGFCSDESRGLTFLRNMNVSGMNFVGLSVGGYCVTREMLQQEGFAGWENAMVTVSDLKACPDLLRRNKIDQRICDQIKAKGLLIRKDILNFVSISYAAETGDVEALNTRLAAGGDPNESRSKWSDSFKNIPPTTAIAFAARNGHETITDILSKHPKFDIKALPAAILAAGKAGHERLKLKLSGMQDIDQVDSDNNSLLHHAVNRGDVDEVSKLIAKHANVNLDGGLGYPLHIAACHSYDNELVGEPCPAYIQIIRILLANRADPNLLQNHSNHNALMIAARAGSAEAVGLLLPVTEKKPVKTVVLYQEEKTVPWFLDMIFSSSGSREWLDILKLLKAEGADLSLPNAYGNDTLLHLVMRKFPSPNSLYTAKHVQESQRAFMKHLQLLDFLLENNVNVSLITNPSGNSALHDFLEKSNLNHVVGVYARIMDSFLSREGFDINAKNSVGKTILHIAAINGDIAAVRYLISRGANVDAQDELGNTPLHYSVGNGFPAHAYPLTTACLVQANAKTDIKNRQGLTASEQSIAVQNEFMQTASARSWSEKGKAETLNDFHDARDNLSIRLEGKKQNDFNSHAMQNFIQYSRENNIHKYSVGNIAEEDRFLIDMYRDDVTGQVMRIPVILNERVYDLDTILNIHTDPFTGEPFDLSHIEPAKMIADEIKILLQYLQDRYPGDVPVSAPGVNGVFGRSQQYLTKQSNVQKPVDCKGACSIQ